MVDEDLERRRSSNTCRPSAACVRPTEQVAQARAAAALHADAQSALVDALLGDQRADLARRAFG